MKKNSNAEKNRLLKGEKPLCDIDNRLQGYALQYNLKLTKNHKEWPERSLSWKTKATSKLIQLYLEKDDSKKFLLWGCIFQDKTDGRYWWKKDPVAFEIPLDWKIIESTIQLLKDKLDKVDESQLTKS